MYVSYWTVLSQRVSSDYYHGEVIFELHPDSYDDYYNTIDEIKSIDKQVNVNINNNFAFIDPNDIANYHEYLPSINVDKEDSSFYVLRGYVNKENKYTQVKLKLKIKSVRGSKEYAN